MRLFLVILLLSSAIIEAKAESKSTVKPRLFLAGGSLKTCSSMALKNCTDKRKAQIEQNNQQEKTTSIYRLTPIKIAKIIHHWPTQIGSQDAEKIRSSLKILKQALNDKVVNKQQLRQAIKNHEETKWFNRLPDRNYYYLFDMLEEPVMYQGKRVKERVYLNDSTNPFSIELYRQFVQMAADINNQADSKPNILVVTASARDPFEAVDFYTQVFTQAGANVQWLPIDATLQYTWHDPNDRFCISLRKNRMPVQGSIGRNYIYPEYFKQQEQACSKPQILTEMVALADGIFINGGDQSLTVQAFKDPKGNDYPLLKQIRQKINQGKLIIGGTSAGTAVMSGKPMISNGLSTTALIRGAKADVLPLVGCHKINACPQNTHHDDLTYRSTGGLDLFSWGIMDTHFSERGRQGRLAQLARDTKTTYGFGVDETTAMLVSWADKKPQTIELKVLGQSGVYIVENTEKQILTHYITRDDKAAITPNNQLTIDIATWKNAEPLKTKTRGRYGHIFQGLRYKTMAELLCRTNNNLAEGKDQWEDNPIAIKLNKQKSSLNRQGAIQVGQEIYQYCSYSDYVLQL